MAKTERFPEPKGRPSIPGQVMAKPSGAEKVIKQKFEPLLPADIAEQLACTIVNVAVDIACYQHSVQAEQDHRDRLEKSARFFANARFVRMCTEEPALLDQVMTRLDTITWPPRVPIPTVVRPAPDSDEDSSFALVFVNRTT